LINASDQWRQLFKVDPMLPSQIALSEFDKEFDKNDIIKISSDFVLKDNQYFYGNYFYMDQTFFSFLQSAGVSANLLHIAEKVLSGKRITIEEGIILYNEGDLSYLSFLADAACRHHNGDRVYFNRNFHIEPTNICINHCTFCSYRRKRGQEGSWEYCIDDIREKTESHINSGVTEVHIVGGVHPDRNVFFYAEMLKEVKKILPDVQIKAFTAVEIDAMCRFAGISVAEGLRLLKGAGLDSMPGGGAEIFDEQIRQIICPDKAASSEWLRIHQTAHQLGIPTNSTMLYGLIEKYEHRIDHMNRLRELQDRTRGFNAFIPLKFHHYNNSFSHIEETTTIEDLKNYAVARIFLDNIPHLKAYWPMIGKQVAQMALAFGVDDLDGTIDDSTRIYSMAGSAEKNPAASTDELIAMIKGAHRIPVERDTIYNTIRIYN
jgi:aminodeoxyfutalosine synthase